MGDGGAVEAEPLFRLAEVPADDVGEHFRVECGGVVEEVDVRLRQIEGGDQVVYIAGIVVDIILSSINMLLQKALIALAIDRR